MGHDKKGGGGDGTITVVLNVDLHCKGCAEKLKKSVEGFDGVEWVKADIGDGKLTVVGKVDPSKLRDRVAAKTHKKVDLVSPAKTHKNVDLVSPTKTVKKPLAEKDSNEYYWTKCTVHGVSTVVLKTRIHCDDCSKRIRRIICNLKGVRWVRVDAQKGLVTVKGKMDVQELPEVLQRKLNQEVHTVPPKKDDGGEKKDEGGDKKDEGGDKKGKGGEKERSGKKETVVGGGGGGGGRMDDGGKVEANRMEYYAGYTYGIEKEKGGQKETVAGGGGGGGWKDDGGKAEANRTEYSAGYTYGIEIVHAPELFSDENPNACSVM